MCRTIVARDSVRSQRRDRCEILAESQLRSPCAINRGCGLAWAEQGFLGGEQETGPFNTRSAFEKCMLSPSQAATRDLSSAEIATLSASNSESIAFLLRNGIAGDERTGNRRFCALPRHGYGVGSRRRRNGRCH